MPQAAHDTASVIAVGIDTARYGHHVTFLDGDSLEPAAQALEVLEDGGSYQQLAERLHSLHHRNPHATFRVRIDVAGDYAKNLSRFLQSLPLNTEISFGDPIRNNNYRRVHSPKAKTDARESYAMARFAAVEQPQPAEELSEAIDDLRELAGRLETQTRETTRTKNQLHNTLARAFPEITQVASNLHAEWVLRLLASYPTARKIARAKTASLSRIPHLTEKTAQHLQQLARDSVGARQTPATEALVTDLAEQLREQIRRQNRIEKLLIETYQQLPESPPIDSIPGIGRVGAAVITAKIGSIQRFPTPERLVGYFGVFPEISTSGFTRKGVPHQPGSPRISPKGNDLVRKYLWFAAQTAIRNNPACKALYQRQRARGKRGDVALGHVMRKLLHQIFAIWNTGQPFDPNYEHHPESPE